MSETPFSGRHAVGEPVASGPPVHTEGTAPGAQLRNYVNKNVSEDGTYVTIVTHSERIEMVPQPLTPEEIAQQKKTERIGIIVAGVIATAFFGVMGWVIYQDEKSFRDEEPVKQPPAKRTTTKGTNKT